MNDEIGIRESNELVVSRGAQEMRNLRREGVGVELR